LIDESNEKEYGEDGNPDWWEEDDNDEIKKEIKRVGYSYK